MSCIYQRIYFIYLLCQIILIILFPLSTLIKKFLINIAKNIDSQESNLDFSTYWAGRFINLLTETSTVFLATYLFITQWQNKQASFFLLMYRNQFHFSNEHIAFGSIRPGTLVLHLILRDIWIDFNMLEKEQRLFIFVNYKYVL